MSDGQWRDGQWYPAYPYYPQYPSWYPQTYVPVIIEPRQPRCDFCGTTDRSIVTRPIPGITGNNFCDNCWYRLRQVVNPVVVMVGSPPLSPPMPRPKLAVCKRHGCGEKTRSMTGCCELHRCGTAGCTNSKDGRANYCDECKPKPRTETFDWW